MIELTFKHDSHVTKNTFRFEEVDEESGKPLERQDQIIGKIYVKKFVFGEVGASVPPDSITMKLEW